jgi:Trk K+ transport system NAD-binding subunit
MFFISPFSKHVSKKISELEPFKYEDMRIIGIIRQNKLLTRSLEDLVLEENDSLMTFLPVPYFTHDFFKNSPYSIA